jgi:hypothetical protein
MTIVEALRAAQDGDIIDWSGREPITGLKSINKAVTIRGATFVGGARVLGCSRLTIEDFVAHHDGKMTSATNVLGVEACTDVTIARGRLSAESGQGRALLIARSRGIRARDMDVSGTARGVYVDISSDIVLTDTVAHGLRSDGVDISRAQGVTIDGLIVRDIDIGTSGAHPDVIQIINSPTNPGTCSDILIRRVRAAVQAQGICLFDHGRGGADRVTIEDCDILTSYYHAINMEAVRGLTLRNIRVGRLAGTPERIKPWVRTTGSTDVIIDNVIDDWDGLEPAAETTSPIAAMLDRIDELTQEIRVELKLA